jgi:hypothetical protein
VVQSRREWTYFSYCLSILGENAVGHRHIPFLEEIFGLDQENTQRAA